jgi:hypothetical protein
VLDIERLIFKDLITEVCERWSRKLFWRAGKCCFFSRKLVNEFKGGKNNQYLIFQLVFQCSYRYSLKGVIICLIDSFTFVFLHVFIVYAHKYMQKNTGKCISSVLMIFIWLMKYCNEFNILLVLLLLLFLNFFYAIEYNHTNAILLIFPSCSWHQAQSKLDVFTKTIWLCL